MPTYVLLTTLTAEGGHTLHAHPERMLEVNQEITEFGCTVVSQYESRRAGFHPVSLLRLAFRRS